MHHPKKRQLANRSQAIAQGVRIFGEILHFFERWNNWGGWGIFIGLFIANVTLFLPGVALILGAGFIFG